MVKKLSEVFDIRDTTAKERTIEEISFNVQLKGFNIWILICASFLASIGLDTNSVAVIIGAMLISPLMSPILGVGLSLGINDNELLYKSFRDLLLAVIISLFVSSVYFFLTPLGEITNEIWARTKPTLLDVLVALFGGIAGIVSISRKDRTNAIPGVAIATALMPPLCTAGFGIAKGDGAVFLGAFYLFFINATFISLSTYLIVKYLDFPLKSYVNKVFQTKVRKVMGLLVLLIVAPSIYFLFGTYSDIQSKKKIEQLIINSIKEKENEVIKWEIQEENENKLIKVYFSGNEISQETVKAYEDILLKNGLEGFFLKPIRTNLSRDEVLQLSSKATQDILNQIELLSKEKKKDPLSAVLQPDVLKKLDAEVKALYSEITTISIGEIHSLKGDSTVNFPLLWIEVNNSVDNRELNKMQNSLYRFFKIRLNKDSINLVMKRQEQ